ncbi:MAG TPA: UDP-N-acetylmuramoyl-L-alanyl-D-glutamate--2,6-diaminopimelate ligase, partial [Betaproteobacteria bacterium]|nr:UDP-N-acetylmuramoyl-L-alanyl-D-glutamate--2,6-diaminopimelate ligase [Betaproteobacteria bacterium]
MMAETQRRDADGAAGNTLPAFDMAQLETLNAPRRRIRVDSRQLADGEIFVAIPGASGDGRDHIADALARGAGGVLWEPAGFAWRAEWRVPHLAVPGLRARLGEIAVYFYGNPSADLWVIGVTGTNGKTS